MAKNRAWTILFLLLAVFSNGCREYPRFVKEGPLFTSPEKAAPGRALVYVYWPREEQGGRDHLWAGTCEGLSEEILPGGYTTLDVEPGPSCFNVETRSEIKREDDFTGALVIQDLGSVELDVEPGRTFFIRLEQRRLPLISRINPRPVEPAVADPEIRRCRRAIPLTPDELAQQLLQEGDRHND